MNTSNQDWLQTISVQIFKFECKFFRVRALKAGSDACKIVRSLVKVSVVKKILLLKDGCWHCNYHING